MSNLTKTTETKTEKSNLTLAFEQVEKLKLNLTLEQKLELNDILFTLATNQYSKGLKHAKEIYNNL
jgi:hypothetical protein